MDRISMTLTLLASFLAIVSIVQAQNTPLRVPAVRVVRFQVLYPNATLDQLSHIKKWNNALKNSLLASMNFVDKHWRVCGNEDPTDTTCGKLHATGEELRDGSYLINSTFIAQRDPVRNVKGDATSTIFGVLNMGLRGGIFQYTNQLKILGQPSNLTFDEAFFCYPGAVLNNVDHCSLCVPGSYHDKNTGSCDPCPKGQYQPLAGKANCFPCDFSFTTLGLGSSSKDQCILECPPGHFLDNSTHGCEPCGYYAYQPVKGSMECIKCPRNKVALAEASTSLDHCVENCPPGEQHSLDGQTCEKCRPSYYKEKDAVICSRCPDGSTTEGEGATKITDCSMPLCPAGTFLDKETKKCEICPRGTYQESAGAVECTPCDANFTTTSTGATNSSHCISTNQCKTGEHKCHWLAICFDLPDDDNKPMFGCKCKPGFIGNGIECNDVCTGWCHNGGTCIKNAEGVPRCECSNSFSGNRCDEAKKE
uniref:EGF-like domain-containing protein n=1 Tax=Plectus sambesii TaxID=2011161 RepID=A0A914X826_9BILA